MTGALIMSQTLPTVIAMGVVSRAIDTTMGRQGRKVSAGTLHYHYKGKTSRAVSHRHPGGHIAHQHKGLPGYGRTRKSLRR